ncbi:MAG TPA: tetratricopeptide repeat protein [Gemmataceae bacterium]|nr:tetratricopeptide repeat protein [Gemmataceae bacterium]
MTERSIFLAALDLEDPSERSAYLARACAGDAALRAQVEQLLKAHQDSGRFMDRPAAELIAAVDEPLRERTGAVVGPYKLLEQIGEGGFGLVFMAEQQEPLRRKVALKILKPGMDLRQVVARFEAERQALALMDHPNIAKIFDGGATESGRPYFVMELVKGAPVTKYCDEYKLTPRQRLELFVPVCQAVQHAHQKGVIHRDLKPSNVLAALYDGKLVPKVIDFGVAKAVGPALTDKTLFTGFGALVGTLEYMSPEQAQLNQLDVDTRSDIYSLGVLLYELLTGTTPLERQRLKDTGLLEALRLIREEETPRPSVRLSTSAESPALAANRGLEPKKLSTAIRGELDWIVMKALEKDRNRRYDTVGAFAADVERYLRDEPVLACPPSAMYRFSKFTRRNKVGLSIAGLVLLFIASLGCGVAWVIHDQAARQARATDDLANVLDRADLLVGQGKVAEAQAALDRTAALAREAAPDRARDERRAALQERLDAAARDQDFMARFEQIRLVAQSRVEETENRFARAAAAFPEIRDALRQYEIAVGDATPAQVAARVKGRPAPVQGNLIAALDECLQAPKADPQTRQWLLAALLAADDDEWRVRVRQAWLQGDRKALEHLAGEADVQTQPPSFLLLLARNLPDQAKQPRLELLRRVQRAHPTDLWANVELALELQQGGKAAEAVRYYTAALALRPDNPGLYLNRGNALRDAGEVDAALADYQQSLALASQPYAAPHVSRGDALRARGQVDKAIDEYHAALAIKTDDATAHCELGTAFYREGRQDDALAEYQEAVRLKEDLANAHYGLGLVLFNKNQADKAAAEYQKAIDIDSDYAEPHVGLGLALFSKAQVDDAIAEYQKAIQIKKDSAEAHYGLGMALRSKKKVDEAIAEYEEAIRLKKDFAEVHYSLGVALRSKGQVAEAVAAYQEAIQIRPEYAEAHYNLGNALMAEGKVDDAVVEYQKAIHIREDYAEAHYNLGEALSRQGEVREALDELRRGQALGSKNPGWRDPSGQSVRQCQRLVELDERLPGFLDRTTTPASTGERIDAAALCSLKRLNRAAVRFYEEAFAAEPKLAEDLGARCRCNAARAAALAGCGEGKDVDKLDDRERARLRRQALDWLRADLEAWGRLLDSDPGRAGASAMVAKVLQDWRADAGFAGVRESEALLKLPEAERRPWRMLWGDVDDALARTQEKIAPDEKPHAK